jgi:trk system potassium uptake protein TrkA
MYIIIVGGGRVGYYLIKALLEEKHEVVLVEKDEAICNAINDELGSVCVRGDGSEVSVLSDIGTNRADMFIAVTGDDEDNLVACQLAKHHFKVPRTIAQLLNPTHATLFKKLGIDVPVISTEAILEIIEAEIPTHTLTHLRTIKDRDLEIIEIRIPPKAMAVGKAIKELKMPPTAVLALILRKGIKPFCPSDETIIQADDRIVAATPVELESDLRISLGVSEPNDDI